MKLCSVFGYMGYQVSVRNDIEWHPELLLSETNLDITYHEPLVPPSDAEFNAKANELLAVMSKSDIEEQKKSEYPSIYERLSALEKQVNALCQKSLISFEPDFMKTLSDIEKVDTKYLLQS